MNNLFLIRHPAVEQRLGQPARTWPLSEEGYRQAQLIANQPWWSGVTHLYSSTETKTIQTARIILPAHPTLIY